MQVGFGVEFRSGDRSGSALAMQNRQIFGLILLGVIVGLGLFVVKPFLAPLAWAAVLAYVTGPPYRRILRLSGDRPSLAAAVTTSLLIVILVVPVSFLLIHLQSELADAYRELSTRFADEPLVLPEFITRIPVVGPALNEALTWVWNDPEFRKQQVNEWLEPWLRELAGMVGKIGRSVVELAVTAVALFFFYRDGDRALEQVRRGLRKVVGDRAEHYFKAVGDTARAVVSGLIVSALAQGFLAGVGYAIIGVGTPILLGALTALAALVPFIGTVAVWGPIGVWLLLSDQIGTGVRVVGVGRRHRQSDRQYSEAAIDQQRHRHSPSDRTLRRNGRFACVRTGRTVSRPTHSRRSSRNLAGMVGRRWSR